MRFLDNLAAALAIPDSQELQTNIHEATTLATELAQIKRRAMQLEQRLVKCRQNILYEMALTIRNAATSMNISITESTLRVGNSTKLVTLTPDLTKNTLVVEGLNGIVECPLTEFPTIVERFRVIAESGTIGKILVYGRLTSLPELASLKQAPVSSLSHRSKQLVG